MHSTCNICLNRVTSVTPRLLGSKKISKLQYLRSSANMRFSLEIWVSFILLNFPKIYVRTNQNFKRKTTKKLARDTRPVSRNLWPAESPRRQALHAHCTPPVCSKAAPANGRQPALNKVRTALLQCTMSLNSSLLCRVQQTYQAMSCSGTDCR